MIRDLETLTLPPNVVVSSKDIAALYPSIPIKDAISAVRAEMISSVNVCIRFDFQFAVEGGNPFVGRLLEAVERPSSVRWMLSWY